MEGWHLSELLRRQIKQQRNLQTMYTTFVKILTLYD